MSRSRKPPFEKETVLTRLQIQIYVKRNCIVNRANIFAEKIKVEGSVTFQNIFSSIMADFRAVVSVLPCSPTNKGKKNLCGCAGKANRQWAFVAFWLSSYVNIKTAAAFADWLAPKKGALFSLIYFFGSFCILYYIPHNYVIPQAMPPAIPQTHSAFYPHRTKWQKSNLALNFRASWKDKVNKHLTCSRHCMHAYRKLMLCLLLFH